MQQDFHGVAREVDGEIVSAFGFDFFQDDSCLLHTATDRPYTRALVRGAFWVAFEQWGYARLYAIVETKNAKSLNLARHLGFREIGPATDLWFGVMEKEDCRWLRSAKRQQTCQAAAAQSLQLPQ